VSVNVEEGEVNGSLRIKVVNKQIESADGEITDGNTLRLKDGLSQATIQLK
jgi:hypothetical protein